MDEMSFGAKLARNNINILSVTQTNDGVAIIYEYQWRPSPGVGKWQKGLVVVSDDDWSRRDDRWLDELCRYVNNARKQLEG